ncbi:hypothetical protein [Rhodanobacter glycinis]|nr:hypothetical protein [Rhodanobacter glycinis]
MPESPTFEQLLSWVLDASDKDEETFAEWLARQPPSIPESPK